MKARLVAVCMAVMMTFAGAGFARAAIPPWAKHIIVYDGYLQQQVNGTTKNVMADTLFVVNNVNPFGPIQVWAEIMDKKGKLVWEGILWDGGVPTNMAPAQGFVWFTLGQMVPRTTQSPFSEIGAGEKFQVRISADDATTPGANFSLVPTVEVKQVVYRGWSTFPPERRIWRTEEFFTWAEAALGGNKHATGVVYSTQP